MKKYNKPCLEMIVLFSKDCITFSDSFSVLEEHHGDDWDWSKYFENQGN